MIRSGKKKGGGTVYAEVTPNSRCNEICYQQKNCTTYFLNFKNIDGRQRITVWQKQLFIVPFVKEVFFDENLCFYK